MTKKIIKDENGEIVVIDYDEVQGQNYLENEFKGASMTLENIEIMSRALTERFRYDPEQIKRVILAHFRKRKG